jgi:hypothetical protein
VCFCHRQITQLPADQLHNLYIPFFSSLCVLFTCTSQDSTDVGTNDKGLSSEITISGSDILDKEPVIALNNPDYHRREKAIGFLQALRIPVLPPLILNLIFKFLNFI